MHLLVLSAFRRGRTMSTSMHSFGAQCFPTEPRLAELGGRAQVSMHLLVLSAFRLLCQFVSDRAFRFVSMHLLVLSAFRPKQMLRAALKSAGLNAPFGAQCFPTPIAGLARSMTLFVSMHLLVLSAFRPKDSHRPLQAVDPVSMHLLVLSAFRRKDQGEARQGQRLNAPFGAQCFPTELERFAAATITESQCTFWCSVLSDT